MKEFETPLTKSLLPGLRKDSRVARGPIGLVQCQNLVPMFGTLNFPGTFPRPWTPVNALYDWPFPTILRTSVNPAIAHSSGFFVGTRTKLYEVHDNFPGSIGVRVTCTNPADYWEVLDFQKYLVFNNGTDVYVRSPTAETISLVSSSVIPRGKSMINFRGQIVMGNISEGTNWLKWGNIGEAEFTVDARNTAGNGPIPFNGAIKRLMYLDTGPDMSGRDRGSVVVYADTGIAILRPYTDPSVTFGYKLFNQQYGVYDWGCVGGHNAEHIFIDNRGYLRRMVIGKEGELLGYKEFMAPLMTNEPRIIYDAIDNQYFIMTDEKGYIFSREGMGELTQIFTDGWNNNGVFSVLGEAPVTATVELSSDQFDLSIRARKLITSLAFGIETDGTAVASVKGRLDYKGSFYQTPWYPLNAKGICTPIMTGVDFKVLLKVTGFTTFKLDEASIRWKLLDKTEIRGTYGNAQATSGAD